MPDFTELDKAIDYKHERDQAIRERDETQAKLDKRGEEIEQLIAAVAYQKEQKNDCAARFAEVSRDLLQALASVEYHSSDLRAERERTWEYFSTLSLPYDDEWKAREAAKVPWMAQRWLHEHEES